MCGLHPAHAFPGTLKQGVIVKRMLGQQAFQRRRNRCIKVNAEFVDQQAKGRATRPPWMQRAQEGVFNADQGGAGQGCNRLPSGGGRAAPPNADPVAGAWPSNADVPTGQFKNTTHPATGQKTTVVNEKPPGGPGGFSRTVVQFASVSTEATAFSGLRKAASALLNRTNGASVT